MPAFDENGSEPVSKKLTGGTSNHGLTMALGRKLSWRKKAVANVSAASNAAKAMNSNLASAGGVTEVVRRMLIERSIDGTVTADADLREIGLTSLDMVDLVLSVECEFDLQIPEAQITPANFRSISAIDALVSALRG
ncbi:MAG TPA: phosphopantetheine-binding protein [Xanthobacteraceae bacterium]|jgi:acyl carrier protein